ncbi:MAG: alpha/beta hydrolase [Sphingomonas bacterium]|nr:alpha/beta hydrolase [Sphingomonas bacterium]
MTSAAIKTMNRPVVHAPPSGRLALTEIPRALIELGSLRLAAATLAKAPRGDGHPVLVLPGFIAGDNSTRALRRYLIGQGHDAHAWQLGRNLGPRSIGAEGEKLMERVAAIHSTTGRRVSLVGWSLGGIMARLVAARMPDAVRRIVTLGSPFAGDPRTTNVWRLYQTVTGHRIESDSAQRQLAEAAGTPTVPSTAIYSRDDGIVSWRSCREKPGLARDNIEVRGSHLGLAINPAVLYAVADRLALDDGDWRPFDSALAPTLGYPAR